MGGTVKTNTNRHNEAQLGYAPNGAQMTGQPFIVFDEFVVAFAPLTANQSVRPTLKWKEFG